MRSGVGKGALALLVAAWMLGGVAPVARGSEETLTVAVPGVREMEAMRVEDRAREIEALIAVAGLEATDKAGVESKVLAIRMLGEVKAAEAAEVLAGQAGFRHVDRARAPLKSTAQPNWMLPHSYYPAFIALVAIGEESTPAVLAALRKIEWPGANERNLKATARMAVLVQVLLVVEGAEAGKKLLQAEMEKSPEKNGMWRAGIDCLDLASRIREIPGLPHVAAK